MGSLIEKGGLHQILTKRGGLIREGGVIERGLNKALRYWKNLIPSIIVMSSCTDRSQSFDTLLSSCRK